MPSEKKGNSQVNKEETSEKPHHGNPSGTERLKVVIRRLPPNLPEDVFWNSVKPWVTDETAQWKAFYAGKIRSRPNKDNVPSRAYVAFRSEDQLAIFSREYDGHVFRDKAGNESYAVVEYAPFQKVPSEKRKQDARIGTIEEDEDYISFIKSLNPKKEDSSEATTMERLLSSVQAPAIPTTTPLLEALKAEKSAKNDRETILRNHAHYKDLATDAKKVDAGKKGGPANPKSPEQKLSRKAKKAVAAAAAAQSSSNATPTPPKMPTPAQKPTPSTSSDKAPPANAPKAPRAIRQRQAAEAKAAAAAAAAAAETANGSSPAPSTSNANSSRRGRPVVGLASRQFEAALSGVVGGPGERRSKKEDKRKATPSVDESTAATPTVPPSPKKDRGAAKRKEGNETADKVPSILQRLPPPPTETEGQTSQVSQPTQPNSPPQTSQETRGSRHRRGRGRGRGGGRGSG